MSATTATSRHHPSAAVWRAPRSRARARTAAPSLSDSPSAANNALAGSGSAPGNSHRREQIGFTGRYLDKETGLWYFRARYYSGSLGRFIGRDEWRKSIWRPTAGDGYPVEFNLYQADYVPNYMDPYGYNPVLVVGGVVVGGGLLLCWLFGCFDGEEEPSTLDVKKCQVVVFHNHGSASRPHTFNFESPTCSAGIFGGCGAGPTNANINPGNSIAGVPGYTDSGDDQIGGGGQGSLSDDFLRNVAARGGSADDKAKEICADKAQCCDEVKVHFLGNLPKPMMGQEWGGKIYDKVRTLNCKTGAWTYGK